MQKIALVEDDLELNRLFVRTLKMEGYDVTSVDSGGAFLSELKKDVEKFDLIITDYRLPDLDGFALFQECRKLNLLSPFVIMTAFGDFEIAVKILKAGVSDYLVKPIKPEVLVQKVKQYMEQRSLQQEAILARMGKKVVARSQVMNEILMKLSRVAPSKASILFAGESGTGKEVFARAVHEASARGSGGFVAVNVSAVPETLFEAEFFGYKKGAFTDAVRDHDGYARKADGGTLFLDEIGDLSPSGQAKLLRLLEERTVQPLGTTTVLPVDFRLISASNRNLEMMIREGRFREDLYYRIAVVRLRIPALRERTEDVIPIARHLLSQLAQEEDLQVFDFTPQAHEIMLSYSWPGNVRELKNRIHEALLQTDDHWIDGPHLQILHSEEPSKEATLVYGAAKREFERRYILRLLKAAEGNVIRAAKVSGLTRKALYDMMKRHNLSPNDFR